MAEVASEKHFFFHAETPIYKFLNWEQPVAWLGTVLP